MPECCHRNQYYRFQHITYGIWRLLWLVIHQIAVYIVNTFNIIVALYISVIIETIQCMVLQLCVVKGIVGG